MKLTHDVLFLYNFFMIFATVMFSTQSNNNLTKFSLLALTLTLPLELFCQKGHQYSLAVLQKQGSKMFQAHALHFSAHLGILSNFCPFCFQLEQVGGFFSPLSCMIGLKIKNPHRPFQTCRQLHDRKEGLLDVTLILDSVENLISQLFQE